ncbi:MAG: helix-hairpin-helix domain-containing protein [Bacteroidetes bacterium]|nr:helix-hairpin-helix domain-containing protein [Bacteroidota bacterium]
MKTKFKDYFTFTKGERNGILFLLILLTLLITVYFLTPILLKKEKTDFSKFEKEINAFKESETEREIDEKDSYKEKYNRHEKNDIDFNNTDFSIAKNKLQPFDFNPNNLPEAEWKKIGLTDKQIKSIKNYENKGGKFRKKEDVKKMYTISPTEYQILEPYIQIPEENKDKFTSTKYEKKNYKNFKVVELNSADTTDLITLKGIGASFARRIYNYRERLGGFYRKEQLMEIKYLDSLVFANIKDFVSVNKNLVTKINVNTATFEQLKKHPYIGYNIAISLINLRKIHGSFKKVEDIRLSVLIDDEKYRKIAPYVEVN